MKKALLIALVLFTAVVSTACINNIAVQELNNKAADYMQKGDYEAAVNRLQASIDLDSSMFETYYNLGIAATSAKKYEVAIEAIQNGLRLKPDFENFYYALSVAQAEYSEQLLEISDEKKEVPEEDKVKSESLKQSAIENAKKYLSLAPEASDKEDIENLIKDLTEDKQEPQKVLEG